MKKLLSIILLGFLVGCSDPKAIVLNDAETINQNADALKKLSEEDKKHLVQYLYRAELGKAFNGMFGSEASSPKSSYGVTVGEAIELQKKYEKEQAEMAAKKAAEEKKAQEEQLAKKSILDKAVTVILVEHGAMPKGQYEFEDKYYVVLKVTNTSNKTIAGIKGVVKFVDKFGDTLSESPIKLDFEDIGGKLAPGASREWKGEKAVQMYGGEQEKKLLTTPTEALKFSYEPETVVFEDGTKI